MVHLIWLPLLFIFFISPCELELLSTKHHLCHHDQMHALLQFKDMFTIDKDNSIICLSSYPKTLSWNNSDCCLWDGVTCDGETGDVIELDLSCSQLYGTINPNNSIGIFRLTHLRRLNLARNLLELSQISPAFGSFTHLTHLNLSDSSFTGSVPPDISFLSKLVSLDISNNFLTLKANDFDSLLKNITHLKELILTRMEIFSSIPNSLLNLTSLEVIDLSWTELQGSLPGQFFMLPNLRELNLGTNNLTGDFPKINVLNTSSLEILELGINALSGQTEQLESISNLTSLRVLDLFGMQFTGKLPDSILNLTSLRVLDLSYMQFIGKLPDSIGSLELLTSLHLRGCNFSGAIPKSLGNLTEIIDLGLLSNNFHSQVPITILNMKNLVSLDLRNNRLIGPIPTNSISLPKLQRFSLANNMINGTLPPLLFTLPSLVDLDMSYNQLTGPIPDFQSQSSLNRLDLSNNQLQGPIPHSMMNLVNLTHLHLSSNNLSGNVERLLFSKLEYLYFLDLSRNSFQGSFPLLPKSINGFLASHNKFSGNIHSSICNLTSLGTLDVSYNDLGGAIPQCLLNISNLQLLNLGKNKFNGSIPSISDPDINLEALLTSHNAFSGNIPSSICNLTFLQILDVSYNDLGGVIPPCLVNNSYLTVLDLQKNRFTGTIPPICAYGTELKTLNLNGNHLERHVPKYLANCKSLELVDLGRNRLNGSFPHWLESLPELQVLVLRSNKFQGPIGKSRTKSPYPKLRIFDLSDNEFSGRLPVRYFQHFIAMKNLNETKEGPTYMEGLNMLGGYYQDSIEIVWKSKEVELEHILTTLATIDLSANKFEGEIPEVLQELISLRMLNLSHNKLAGPIPTSLGNLTNLDSLDLSYNILNGTIPMDLASIPRLTLLNVSNNHLVGPIPRGKQFNTFENNSYVGNSGLCGFPLSNSCGKPPSPPKVTQQKEDYSIFSGGFTWKIVLFGYGCGVPFGLILGFLMHFFGWPRWFQKIGKTENRRKVKRPNGIADRPRRR